MLRVNDHIWFLARNYFNLKNNQLKAFQSCQTKEY